MIPEVGFFVNKYVNLFYHLSVLFSEYYSDEESNGFLNNQEYRTTYAALKIEKLHKLFQNLQKQSFYTWDFVGKSLFEANDVESLEKTLRHTTSGLVDRWLEIYSEAEGPYEEIWTRMKPRLMEYAEDFGSEWNMINEHALHKMSQLAKRPWKEQHINVHLVDCIHGAAAWVNDIAIPPFPDFDVEKKLLAHELAHTLLPDHFLKTLLRSFQLDPDISHTIIDLIAYFSIREHVSDPDRRGIRPNPDHYKDMESIYPIFDESNKTPTKHQSLDEILRKISN